MKVCSVCKREHDSVTKTCEKCKEYNRNWRAKNRDRDRAHGRKYYATHKAEVKERSRKRHAANPLRSRRRHLIERYGLSDSDYEQILVEQNGVCAICSGPPKLGKNLDVDHCHDTGKVRGLLCRQCNVAIGSLKDDPKLTRAATEYLEKER